MIATTSRPAQEPAKAAGPAGHFDLQGLLSRPYPAVMGVLNVTPVSFSDGGQFATPERALAQARRMFDEGADIIDVGAESTRPYGSEPISADEELQRLKPVLSEVAALGVPVSIDSMKSAVIAWALDQGAVIANDVWGLQRDPAMAGLVAAREVPVIIMHNRDSADPAIDIMKDIAAFFARSLDIAAKGGVSPGKIVLDPGIGFGKTAEQSMIALARRKGFEVVERHIMPDELPTFTECFITGTAAEVTPVSEIGEHKYRPGNISLSLMDDYATMVRRAEHEVADALDF